MWKQANERGSAQQCESRHEPKCGAGVWPAAHRAWKGGGDGGGGGGSVIHDDGQSHSSLSTHRMLPAGVWCESGMHCAKLLCRLWKQPKVCGSRQHLLVMHEAKWSAGSPWQRCHGSAVGGIGDQLGGGGEGAGKGGDGGGGGWSHVSGHSHWSESTHTPFTVACDSGKHCAMVGCSGRRKQPKPCGSLQQCDSVQDEKWSEGALWQCG